MSQKKPADYRVHFTDEEMIQALAGKSPMTPNMSGFFSALPMQERQRIIMEAEKLKRNQGKK